MYLLGLCLLLAYFHCSNFANDVTHSDYDEHEHEHTDVPEKADIEQKLRSASSVDELMSLIYPSYWAALKCRSKLSQRPQTRHLRPFSRSEEPTFAAAFLNLDILKSIEVEWRKTRCTPREVCGGCCHSEDKQCRNISSSYLSKTLFEITVPITHATKPVTISVANHTNCSCLSKLDIYRQVHSIIRRALPECPVANSTCSPGLTWNSRMCRCIRSVSSVHHDTPSFSLDTPPVEHKDVFSADVCGPGKELDVESCQCVCRHKDQTQDCGPHRHLDRNTCQCVCNAPSAAFCPLNHVLNKQSCQCVCIKVCPRHQPLNRTRCSCECNQSPNKCFLKGRRFHPATCSCLRAPCEVRRRLCDPGFTFSEEVCRCVPSHWRQLD
ncbi:vascular endothelial growth factor C isoform X2 [Gouania willdenowi]|uniref:vascular endothelial growth factor C isoform X2 n=1 Tax=Gouania willdenowi TaxID=441366 RepID=UPI001054A891|nr:vascular endothelial growth factor C isoform X2 [Gouania willdenowi]